MAVRNCEGRPGMPIRELQPSRLVLNGLTVDVEAEQADSVLVCGPPAHAEHISTAPNSTVDGSHRLYEKPNTGPQNHHISVRSQS